MLATSPPRKASKVKKRIVSVKIALREGREIFLKCVRKTQVVRSKKKGHEFDLRYSQKSVDNNSARSSKNHGSNHDGRDVLDEDRPGRLCLKGLNLGLFVVWEAGWDAPNFVEKRRLAWHSKIFFMAGSKGRI